MLLHQLENTHTHKFVYFQSQVFVSQVKENRSGFIIQRTQVLVRF